MADSVKFIFMTLIKVPVYITVAFFIFNLFAFTFIYFKMLGVSYVVQQTAIENNYLPKKELGTIIEYMRDEISSISMVENVAICYGDGKYIDVATGKGVGTNTDYTHIGVDGLKKKQYGSQVKCGVTCNYIWIWPLDYRTTKNNTENVAGLLSGADYTGTYSGSPGNNAYYAQEAANGRTYDQRASKANDMVEYMRQTATPSDYDDNNISIMYNLPGLKYYPDLT